MYKVYMWTNSINGKRYVGQTKHTLAKRAGAQGRGYAGCTYFYRAIKKYGFDKFTGTILADKLDKSAANLLEKYYIQHYRTTDRRYGYNLTKGGDAEDCELISKRISGTLKNQRSTPEYRAKMSARSKAFWSNPAKRAACLAKRAKKHQGRHPVRVYCEERNKVYADLSKAAKALGFAVGTLSKAFRKHGRRVVVGKTKKRQYTLYRIDTTVENKDAPVGTMTSIWNKVPYKLEVRIST